jgi:hypothetical protein
MAMQEEDGQMMACLRFSLAAMPQSCDWFVPPQESTWQQRHHNPVTFKFFHAALMSLL